MFHFINQFVLQAKCRELSEKCLELKEQNRLIRKAYTATINDYKASDHAKNRFYEDFMRLQIEMVALKSENRITLQALEQQEQASLVIQHDLNKAKKAHVAMIEQVLSALSAYVISSF